MTKQQLKTYMELIEFISSQKADSEKAVSNIYTITHIALERCKNPHPDWVEKWDKVIKELKKIGEL